MSNSGKSIGLVGIIKLGIAFSLVVANIAFYTILPIAGLNFLPMIIACITLVSSTLDDLGLNDG